MVVTESFAPQERQTARERMDLALRRLRSADEEAMAERAEMLAARDALGTGSTGFGDHHLTVLVRERDLARLDDATASVAAALADTGAIAVREDTNLEPAFWGQFPGNEAFLVRRAMISTANMASFGSCTASRSARRPATTGATRWRCSRPPARRRSSSTSTTATSATSRSSARRARARPW